MTTMTQKTLILIDGHALAYRCYFALERTRMKTTENVNTWAVYGFMKAIFDLLRKVKPDALAVSFDKGRETFRLAEYSEYKANRQAMPYSLKEQMGLINEGINALEIPVYQMSGFEADDIIGTIAKKASDAGHKTIILTGDKDSFQLIDNDSKVSVLIPTKGELVEYDRSMVYAKLGVYPEQVADFKGLSGDSSDNIPGVKGIGDKTAAKLLEQFGSMEKIYEHLDEISPTGVKQKLEADREAAFMSKYLATICREVPLEFDFDGTKLSPPDGEKLEEFFRRLQFKNFLNGLPEILSMFGGSFPEGDSETFKVTEFYGSKSPAKSDLKSDSNGQIQLSFGHASQKTLEQLKIKEELSSADINFDINMKIIDTEEDFHDFISIIEAASVFSFDIETTSLDVFNAKLVGISFGWSRDVESKDKKVFSAGLNPEKTFTAYIPIGHEVGKQLNLDYILEKLKPIFENPSKHKVLQNAKYEINVLKNYGINLDGIIMDTMVASYVKNPSFKHGLKAQAFGHLGYQMTKIEELIGRGKNQITMDRVEIEKAAPYACADSKSTLELAGKYAQLFSPDEEKLFYEIEQPLVEVLAVIERNGVSVDAAYLKELSAEFGEKISKIEEQIFEIAKERFNPNSPKQVSEILFDKLKLSSKGAAKTQSGISTNAKTLELLANEHPIAKLLLEQRSLAKLKSTYADALVPLINPKTGRIHTNFNQTITTTGRLSSNNPNLQNIPIRTEEGNRIRAAFVPSDKENWLFMSADYSQIELRLLAHASQDETLVQAFRNNEDIHAQTAAKVFSVPLEEVTKEMRRSAKAVNFGIIYGQTAYGLSESLGIPPAEAKDIITKYFQTYPKIKSYMDEIVHIAHQRGFVETLYGRKRYLKDDLESRIKTIREFAQRAAINAPLQGTAADLIKIAMIKLHQKIKEEDLQSKIILQVHDELVLEVYKPELERVKDIVQECMELGQSLSVPLVIDISIGSSWMDAK